MSRSDQIIGMTDGGEPIVQPDHTCAFFTPGQRPTLDFPTCWYCRYADFRKRTDMMLSQSICRRPENRRDIFPGSGNEYDKDHGGNKR